MSMITPKLDLIFIEPHIVAAFFQVGFDHQYEFLVGVVAVAKEDAQGFKLNFSHKLLVAVFADVALLFAAVGYIG